MMDALTTAATGLEAQQAKMADISHDLANVGTDAFKRSRTEFQDLMYRTHREAGGSLGSGMQTPVGIQTGMGVKVGASHKIFEQGPARMTQHPFDIMIEGDGFIPVQPANSNEVAYTRNGAFKLDREGRLHTSTGSRLIPDIVVPINAIEVLISNHGEVKAVLPGNGEAILGQLQLVMFQNQQGLSAQGNSLYKATQASGAPVAVLPGENGAGWIQQGALEGSNVNIATSMTDMITTQRAYEMNTKMMGVADSMLGATVNVIK